MDIRAFIAARLDEAQVDAEAAQAADPGPWTANTSAACSATTVACRATTAVPDATPAAVAVPSAPGGCARGSWPASTFDAATIARTVATRAASRCAGVEGL